MPPPTTLSTSERNILAFITLSFFGARNPIVALVGIHGVIFENPRVNLQLAETYGAIFGALTTLVAIGHTLKYAIRIVKKVIQRKKHRSLKTVEVKAINEIANDTKHGKKVTEKNVMKFVHKRTRKGISPKQRIAIRKVIRKKNNKKVKKFRFGGSLKNYASGAVGGMALPGISTLGYKSAGAFTTKGSDANIALKQKKQGSYAGTGLLVLGGLGLNAYRKRQKKKEQEQKEKEQKEKAAAAAKFGKKRKSFYGFA